MTYKKRLELLEQKLKYAGSIIQQYHRDGADCPDHCTCCGCDYKRRGGLLPETAYTLAEHGVWLERETTPNPLWDEHGYVYLIVGESGGALTFSDIQRTLGINAETGESPEGYNVDKLAESLAAMVKAGFIRMEERHVDG